MNNQQNLTHQPPGYRVSIRDTDPESLQYGHRFGGPFPGVPVCLTCSKPMHLLFLFNLADPRLEFVTIANVMQLPLISCLSCTSVYERQYFALRERGQVVEPVSQQPSEIIGEFLPRPLKQHPISLRPLGADEYPITQEAWYALMDMPESKHQIGGIPLWLQQPVEVECPGCHQPMSFVAMFNDDPDVDTGAERPGIYLADSAILYYFYCGACATLGTAFQSA